MTLFFACTDRDACRVAAQDTKPRALIAVRPARGREGFIYRSVKLSQKVSAEMVSIERETGGADEGAHLVCRPGERLVSHY